MKRAVSSPRWKIVLPLPCRLTTAASSSGTRSSGGSVAIRADWQAIWRSAGERWADICETPLRNGCVPVDERHERRRLMMRGGEKRLVRLPAQSPPREAALAATRCRRSPSHSRRVWEALVARSRAAFVAAAQTIREASAFAADALAQSVAQRGFGCGLDPCRCTTQMFRISAIPASHVSSRSQPASLSGGSVSSFSEIRHPDVSSGWTRSLSGIDLALKDDKSGLSGRHPW